jgi:hypothetical protein
MAGLVPAIHVFLVRGIKNVDARHKAGHDEFRQQVLPQARGPRKDCRAVSANEKAAAGMLPPQENQLEKPSRHSGAIRIIEPGMAESQRQAFENSWSTYSQFTR